MYEQTLPTRYLALFIDTGEILYYDDPTDATIRAIREMRQGREVKIRKAKLEWEEVDVSDIVQELESRFDG
jgi:hypothetical protein